MQRSVLSRELVTHVYKNDVEAVQAALAAGADANACSYSEIPMLLHAMGVNQHAVAVALLDGGANVNAINPHNGATAIIMSIIHGNAVVLQSLLNYGADSSVTFEKGLTALHFAAQQDKPDCLRVLINNGAALDAQRTDGCTALIDATHKESNACVKLLLNGGADANVLADGWSVIRTAGESGNCEIMRMLLEHGADTTTNSAALAVLTAVILNNLPCVNLLLNAGASTEFCDPTSGDAPLAVAAQRGFVDVMRALLEHRADINAKSIQGLTAVHFAIQQNNLQCLELLVARGASLGAQVTHGEATSNTALFYTAQYGRREAMRVLLRAGADVNLCVTNGMSPLMKACQKGKYRFSWLCVTVLLY